MQAKVSALGYQVDRTWTNFLTLDVQQDGREFARKLREQGVLVRPLTAWGAPMSIRVTLGTPEQNQYFIDALSRLKK